MSVEQFLADVGIDSIEVCLLAGSFSVRGQLLCKHLLRQLCFFFFPSTCKTRSGVRRTSSGGCSSK
eukprot:m.80550 g.80550  ORF g.80550 m.80550 type:complete len:66 (-) comp17489_c0_seq1:76-273(-)